MSFQNICAIPITIFVILLCIPAGASLQGIAQGGVVFIGEEGLDVSGATGGYDFIAWFSPEASPDSDSPDITLSVGNPGDFYIAPAYFVGHTGTWYRWDGQNRGAAFNAMDPSIDIAVFDNSINKDVTGKLVTSGDFLNFRIETNTFSVSGRPGYAGEGYVDIEVRDQSSIIYDGLLQSGTVEIPLAGQVVDALPWYWVMPANPDLGWNTGVADANGSPVYGAGTYFITSAIDLNNLRENYRSPDGSYYPGKTISPTRNVKLSGPVSFEMTLYPGWNFISTPKRLSPGNCTINALFGDVDCAHHSIYGYDADTGLWYIADGSSQLSPLYGVWIYSAGQEKIELHFLNDPLSVPPLKELFQGWNALGFADIQPLSARSALYAVDDKWTTLMGFDPISQSYETSIINGAGGDHSDYRELYPGRAYWVYMTDDGAVPALTA